MNGKLYLGSTSDLKRRFMKHNNGENKSTKAYRPFELVYYSAFRNKQDSIECEKYFKTTAGRKRIHRMLKNTLKKSQKAQFNLSFSVEEKNNNRRSSL